MKFHKFLAGLPAPIKVLEVLGRIFLIIFIFSFIYYHSLCNGMIVFYSFGYEISWMVWYAPLMIAFIIELVTIIFYRRRNLVFRAHIMLYLKHLLIVLVLCGIGAVFTTTLCLSMDPATRDSIIHGSLMAIQEQLKEIHRKDGNYDGATCHTTIDPTMISHYCDNVDRYYKYYNLKAPFTVIHYKSALFAGGEEPFEARDQKNNSQAVCFYSPLNLPKNDKPAWFCIDSAGTRGTTTINPATPGYCVDGQSAKCPPVIE